MEIRVFTAFSGYDSQCMALDRLHQHNPDFTYELVGWAEIDKYAIQAHNAVYPQWAERNYGDISKIDWAQVPDFDLFTYSSPCQDFSQAGKQAGGTEGSGTRSSLLWECRRAILAKRPKYLLMENVAALVSQKFIRLFNAWQLELESYGYRNFAKVLNAKDYGVPQNRERIFMVSVLDETARYEFPDPMPLTIRLKDVLEKEVEERYYLSEKDIEGFERRTQRNKEVGNGFAFKPTEGDGVATCIESTSQTRMDDNYIKEPKCQVVGTLPYKSGYENTARVYAAEGLAPSIQSTDGGNTQPKIVEQRIDIVGEVNRGLSGKVYADDGLSPTITAGEGVKYNTKILQRGHGYNKGGEFEDVAPTITTSSYENNNHVIEYGFRIRKLTERECFRLMDMPEEYIDRIQAAGISRSQQYKMAGNSIVVACMYHIWRKLFIDTEIKTLTLF